MSGCKIFYSGSYKDVWLAVREGSLADVDSALAILKKNGMNVNERNTFGLTPLHIATWRNHIPIVRRLLAAGADPDTRDGESGWSSLHRALHFGHLAVASILLQSGASITLDDSKSRTPVDLLSGPLLYTTTGNGCNSVVSEVYSWGSGANYQLGTGNAHIQKLPCRVDSLHGSPIKLVSASKFHSVAVTARGQVFTWGFGRGGRLGHPDFDIHSGQAAVITPRMVIYGLGSRQVKAIAAAKHHTVAATEAGEVYTWGSNREGQLGYTSVDTQPTPRRVSSLRSRIVAVTAANKHTAVVSDTGEVFTWGCNSVGQLGYGTSNSALNYTPRLVESLKGKFFLGVAAAKYHTIVIGGDGEVYTWGHRLVTPKRVVVGRNIKKSGGSTLKFHRMERLHVVAIAAGMVHSLALTDDGALFYWVSDDPDLRCQQIFSLCGRNVVNISAGKYWSSAVTETGDVYMWDGKKGKAKPLVTTRLHGVKRASSVSVGETHLLIIGTLYHPVYPPNMVKSPQKQKSDMDEELEELEYFVLNDMESCNQLPITYEDSEKSPVPSLKSLCEKVAAENLVEPRNAIQLLEIADSLGANDLRQYCEEILIRNLDYVFTVSSHAIASASLEILAGLENVMDLRSSEPWSYRHLPTPTATFPAIINSEEDSENEVHRTRDYHVTESSLTNEIAPRLDSFLQPNYDSSLDICKKIRALRKKLQQIEMLESKQSNGHLLDDQQIAKLQTKSTLENSLADLGAPVVTQHGNESLSVITDGKGNKKAQLSKKQRKKSKQSSAKMEIASSTSGTELGSESTKDFLGVEFYQLAKHKEGDINAMLEMTLTNQATEQSAFGVEENSDLQKTESPPNVSKKKNRKGGLSMFLSGALDDVTKDVVLPLIPKIEGPAWGGAKIAKGHSSLREIQNEQRKSRGGWSSSSMDKEEDLGEGLGEGKIQLSSFLPSKPIPMSSTHTLQGRDGDRCTPPWKSSGTPPLSRPSLRDIQMQQGKQNQSLSHSPKAKVAGFSIASAQGSPSDSPGVNRWFKPEVNTPSSIRSIQIEEKAMKDLKRFYSSVKIIKNQS